eukprot:COSAG06_NODE_2086_length_7632_cov_22.212133_11_plen_79_part_00
MAIKTKHQTVVKYNCEETNFESFENQYFDIPKIINSDITYQLYFGHVPNYYEDLKREFTHQHKNIQIEKDAESLVNYR